MNNLNPKVDGYINRSQKWQKEFVELRKIVLECGLTEDLKWGVPCYAYQKSNIVLMHEFKEYCALLFFKGALLKDASGILVQQTVNVQSARQVRFTSVEQVVEKAATLKAYILEAIEVERSGLKVDFKKTVEFNMTEEFKTKLDEMPALKKAFESLTPGRQRAYLLYFSTPKQSKTRLARVETYMPHILAGKGLNDE